MFIKLWKKTLKVSKRFVKALGVLENHAQAVALVRYYFGALNNRIKISNSSRLL